MDRGDVMEPKKPRGSFGCSVLTLYESGYVGLDWPPTGVSFGGFLVVKEASLKG
jgi:hypothetical protein